MVTTEGKKEVAESVLFNPITVPTAEEGKVYYDSTEKVMKYYDGTQWKALSGAQALKPLVNRTLIDFTDTTYFDLAANYDREWLHDTGSITGTPRIIIAGGPEFENFVTRPSLLGVSGSNGRREASNEEWWGVTSVSGSDGDSRAGCSAGLCIAEGRDPDGSTNHAWTSWSNTAGGAPNLQTVYGSARYITVNIHLARYYFYGGNGAVSNAQIYISNAEIPDSATKVNLWAMSEGGTGTRNHYIQDFRAVIDRTAQTVDVYYNGSLQSAGISLAAIGSGPWFIGNHCYCDNDTESSSHTIYSLWLSGDDVPNKTKTMYGLAKPLTGGSGQTKLAMLMPNVTPDTDMIIEDLEYQQRITSGAFQVADYGEVRQYPSGSNFNWKITSTIINGKKFEIRTGTFFSV